MKSEYDMVEDIRTVKSSWIFNRRLIIFLIAVMLFLISCGMFLQTTYLYAVKQIEYKQKLEDEAAANKNNLTRKTYYIEQRLREDMEKMLHQSN
jgi:hypothetical protein